MSKKSQRKRSAGERALLRDALVVGDRDRELGRWRRRLGELWRISRRSLALLGAMIALAAGMAAILDYRRKPTAQEIQALVALAEHLKQRIEETRDPGQLRVLESQYEETLWKAQELRDSLDWRDPGAADAETLRVTPASTVRVEPESERGRERSDRPGSLVAPMLDEGASSITARGLGGVSASRSSVREASAVIADDETTRGGDAVPPAGDPPPVRPSLPPATDVNRSATRPSDPGAGAEAPAEVVVDSWLHAGSFELVLETPPRPGEDAEATARRARELGEELRRVLP